eukprot:Protomagalhaensia_wolfi_Nauph_80__1424@NODE_1854_length_1307_cov_23_347003_g1447_i0_p1_GENE_NODE_1854_length_1307_cov_23_347003_g1447_i0NODE_1854_length_1307_cov_23_347003_g1447_i0_p1_ORF_typecomplete_len406_score53_37DUF4211/PF13926_6/0_2DUF4211/PF13926_6/70KH_9/PF17904_1/0_14KH_9/PF17904_1/1_1e04DUF5063/PF16702_5/1_8DUF5063/PF16702_5/2_6e02FlxA/PF14282_6/1_2e04FlxA/PF14282_6/0_3Baculo_PEP_C/PF04513_12/1_8e02Baculo_PEP_C/PF04513_12/5_4_NODE_1854_length_1307_cov_23_347003_g1447_i01661218
MAKDGAPWNVTIGDAESRVLTALARAALPSTAPIEKIGVLKNSLVDCIQRYISSEAGMKFLTAAFSEKVECDYVEDLEGALQAVHDSRMEEFKKNVTAFRTDVDAQLNQVFNKSRWQSKLKKFEIPSNQKILNLEPYFNWLVKNKLIEHDETTRDRKLQTWTTKLERPLQELRNVLLIGDTRSTQTVDTATKRLQEQLASVATDVKTWLMNKQKDATTLKKMKKLIKRKKPEIDCAALMLYKAVGDHLENMADTDFAYEKRFAIDQLQGCLCSFGRQDLFWEMFAEATKANIFIFKDKTEMYNIRRNPQGLPCLIKHFTDDEDFTPAWISKHAQSPNMIFDIHNTKASWS